MLDYVVLFFLLGDEIGCDCGVFGMSYCFVGCHCIGNAFDFKNWRDLGRSVSYKIEWIVLCAFAFASEMFCVCVFVFLCVGVWDGRRSILQATVRSKQETTTTKD